MSMAGMAFGAGYSPIQLTPGSFTFNMIVPSNYPALPANYAVTVTLDQGPGGTPPGDNGGNTLYEMGADPGAPTTGLPHANTTLTSSSQSGHKWQLPPSWIGNNCVFVGNYTNIPVGFTNTYAAGDYMTFTTPTAASYLSFLTCAGNGPVGVQTLIYHQDGVIETNQINPPDWFSGNNGALAYICKGRATPQGGLNNINGGNAAELFGNDIQLTDTTSPVTNVVFNYASGGRVAIFAVSGSSDGVNFSPIPISGYNADAVIETLPGPLPYNATMDNGTNLSVGGAGANTFFEKGWDPYYPNIGFPAHGTTITSAATGRPYQMAASYSGNMAALIDTNHQLVNITPANPQPYTAFSLLDAGGNIGGANTMTNIIVLQHADGTSETNTFYAYDWFNTSQPIAYACNGRVNFNNVHSVNNENNTSPRLFESQFQLVNTQSPVTNIQLRFGSYPPGAPASTAWILAVSATAGGIPVSFAGSTVAQNVAAGQTALFSATNAFGSSPVYQWRKGSSVNGPWVNLTDGGNISGSSTLNLTVANVSSSDVGYYECVGTNAVTTNTVATIPAPLTLLVATGSNVVQSTDTISDSGDATTSPAGQDVTAVIDGTLNTYLNYGANGTNAPYPFQGPVSFTVTPQIGNTTVTALRFFVGTNNYLTDPVDYTLAGSQDGVNFTTISSGSLSLPNLRNPATGPIVTSNLIEQEVDFPNTTGYNTYQVTFNQVKDNLGANTNVNNLQIAEVQFIGNLSAVAPGIAQQPVSSVTAFAGANVAMSVVGNGPQPITYQWYSGSTPINGATNATYVLMNAQVANSGSYSVKLSNTYGTTTSSTLNLTVLVAPNSYVSGIMGDGPVAYYRLDEADNGAGNNGTIANDYAGGHNGVYTNVQLGVQGYNPLDPDTAVAFETLNAFPSYVGQIKGLNFATPTNTSGNLSVEAWVKGTQNQVAGAGLVTYGYGGGGEQFALDCGGTSNSFRFYFRDAGGASHNAASPVVGGSVNSADGQWHHVVGVLNESATNEILYVDGLPVVTNGLVPGMGVLHPTNQFPMEIGARASTATNLVPNLQFAGSIDEVAVYNYALTPAQVQNHFFLADIAARLLTSPSNATNSEGTTATFSATPYGTPPVTVQWYNSDGANPTTALAGQTNNTLSLANVTAAMNGNWYLVIASNAYGTATSAPVQLTVVSGPPQIFADLNPPYFVYAGYPLQLSVQVNGTAPLSYGWYVNGNPVSNNARISGANTSTLNISSTMASDSGNYELFITNGYGTAHSVVASVSVLPRLEFNGFGNGWDAQGTGKFTGTNALELTDGNGNEAGASFFSSPLYIGGFQATYTYQDVTGGGADGAAFVIQNDPRGATALGGGGGSLGVSGITPSVELEFNIYSPNTVGFAFHTNGANGTYITPGTVGIDSGDPINVTLTYLNGTATMKLVDTVNSNSFTASTPINIPAIVGGQTAYVGFTGADGGAASTQIITNFTFVSLIGLNVQPTPGNLVITWPTAVGGYVLQQSASLSPASWSAVTATPTVVGGFNQVIIPTSGNGSTYFRLLNPAAGQ